MIDIKNSSTDYLQRSSGTFNNISMLFAGNFPIFCGLFCEIIFYECKFASAKRKFGTIYKKYDF